MKKLSMLILAAFIGLAVNAQDVKFAGLDKSPADIVYFPLNAAKVKAGDPTTPIVKVTYSRPSKKGRLVYGDAESKALEAFGKVSRLGANESTEIKFFKDVTVGNKAVKAGSYSLFAIPNKDNWTIILNQQTDKWGAYTYDKNKDVVRLDVPVKPLQTEVEALSMTFVPQASGANLVIGWDKTSVEVPLKF
jgi:hypothetical protein